jgi:hypothetical protein
MVPAGALPTVILVSDADAGKKECGTLVSLLGVPVAPDALPAGKALGLLVRRLSGTWRWGLFLVVLFIFFVIGICRFLSGRAPAFRCPGRLFHRHKLDGVHENYLTEGSGRADGGIDD